jgi:hypothetical protein
MLRDVGGKMDLKIRSFAASQEHLIDGGYLAQY